MEDQSLKLAQVITTISLSIQQNDKKAILEAYDKAENIDINSCPEKQQNLYDALVDRANELLYS